MIYNIFAAQEALAAGVVIESGVSAAACIGSPIGGMTSGNINYQADWSPIKYLVAFDANADDVENTMSSVEYTYDETGKTLPVNQYERQDYDFVGWCKNVYCASVERISDEATVFNWTTEQGAKIKLYAQWQPACVAKLHIGNDILCLYKTKVSATGMPSLRVKIANQAYYTGMTFANKVIHKGAHQKLHVQYGENVYNVCDLTTEE